MAGWVYIISNKAMPGILKIGYTERTPYIRAYELYNTGCPYPYKVDYSIYVNKPFEVEQKAHELQRSTNVGKEWFSCSQEKAIETIANAIKICGAAIENKVPPKPTQSELDGVIKTNPAAASVIEKDLINKPEPKYASNLRIQQGNTILEFSDQYAESFYKKQIDKINKEYNEKIGEYKKEYELINSNKKDSRSFIKGFFDNFISYLLAGYLIILFPLYIVCILIDVSEEIMLLIYFIICLLLSILITAIEARRDKMIKSNPFEKAYEKELNEANVGKEISISLVIKDNSNKIKVIENSK